MLKLFNTLSRTIEEFVPIEQNKVGMYSCGPTVYQFAHIGNFRSYMTSDVLYRVLQQHKFKVNFVMNITDVGHLVSDEDSGEDKMQKSAEKEGKTAWEVADFYTKEFLADYEALNFTKPQNLAKATDHITEQLELIAKLDKKGFTYKIDDGVYFDTSKFADYGKLSTLDKIKEGARVEVNKQKRSPRDFALWKFSKPEDKRQMEWDSPYGLGFPGWHLECSAMSMRYLGETFDIHTGGVDHISIHHTNEIAQSEAATGKKFVNYWIHTAFMLVANQKMSKSLENTYRLYDLDKMGYTPLDLRYLYLNAHYRQEMNFTFAALDAAKNALANIRTHLLKWKKAEMGNDEYEERFLKCLDEDLNTPQALAVMWEMLKSDIDNGQKLNSLFTMDKVLGLGLEEYYLATNKQPADVPNEVLLLIEERNIARKSKQYTQADQIRNKIKKLGYEILDSKDGASIREIVN